MQFKQTELLTSVAKAASFVKIIMGACNNASWQVCLHAHDRIKTLPAYKMRVKQQFRSALEAFSAYEHELIHGQRNRFFHVADMTAKDYTTTPNWRGERPPCSA